MRKRLDVKAVWDSDLEVLLKNLGILEQLLLGEENCSVCGRTVDLENLGAIIPRGDQPAVTCDDASCVRVVTSPEVSAARD